MIIRDAEQRGQLDTAFHDIRVALSAAERNRAHNRLKTLLAADVGGDPAVNAELTALEKLQPMTRDYYAKLEHIRSAVPAGEPAAAVSP